MMHEEINLKKLNYDLNKSVQFRIVLNEMYNELCYAIHKNKKMIRNRLENIVIFINKNWEEAKNLPKEDLYMVINCIKLARSEKMSVLGGSSPFNNYPVIPGLNKEEFRILEENYRNSR